MARAAPDRAVTPEGVHATEPDRIVAMALEVDAVNAHVLAAADRVVQAGRAGRARAAPGAGEPKKTPLKSSPNSKTPSALLFQKKKNTVTETSAASLRMLQT